MEFTNGHERILLSETDLALLKSMGIIRFAYTGQLQRLHFTGSEPATDERRTRRTLERLTYHKVLVRLKRRVGGISSGSDQFVYALGPAGHRLLFERTQVKPVKPTKTLPHRLEVTELFVRLKEAERRGRLEQVHFEGEPQCWRTFQAFGRVAILKPDAFVQVASGDFEDSWFLEVDRDTEWKSALRYKFIGYRAYFESGLEQRNRGVFPQVLFLAPTDARVALIREEVARQPAALQELFRVERYDQTIAIISEPT
jgi:hypothetical protein